SGLPDDFVPGISHKAKGTIAALHGQVLVGKGPRGLLLTHPQRQFELHTRTDRESSPEEDDLARILDAQLGDRHRHERLVLGDKVSWGTRRRWQIRWRTDREGRSGALIVGAGVHRDIRAR